MVQLTFKSRRLIAAAAEVARWMHLMKRYFSPVKIFQEEHWFAIVQIANTQKSGLKAQITYAFICKEATKRTNSLPYFWSG